MQLNQRTKTAWFSGPSLKQTFGFEQFQSPQRGAIVDHETKISLSFRHIIIIIFHCVHAQQAVKQQYLGIATLLFGIRISGGDTLAGPSAWALIAAQV